VIQVEQLGCVGTALYSLGNTYLTGRRRTYSTTPPPFSVQGQDAYVYNFGVSFGASSINNTGNQIIKEYKLEQNYPNPFNPTSIIRFQIKDLRFVTIKVYDVMGKEIATMVNGKYSPGIYEVTFDGENLSSGMYYYVLYADGVRMDAKKMTLVK
jgi:hypothetical protein